ncbi:MAG: hypothetical protein M1840_003855 [Geoglossum simile]|nr:MAG: hypothetical protein M1840_003855 [Geoglossum simile]
MEDATSKRERFLGRISKILRIKEKPVKRLEPPVPYVPRHAASSFLRTATPLPLSQRYGNCPVFKERSVEDAGYAPASPKVDEIEEYGLAHTNIATGAQPTQDGLTTTSSNIANTSLPGGRTLEVTKVLGVNISPPWQRGEPPESSEAPLLNRDSGFVVTSSSLLSHTSA